MKTLLLAIAMLAHVEHSELDKISFDRDLSSVEEVCKEPQLIFLNGTKPEPKYDKEIIESTKKGCIQYYGKGACLEKLFKLGERNWHALCSGGDK